MKLKFATWLAFGFVMTLFVNYYTTVDQEASNEAAYRQFQSGDAVVRDVRLAHMARNNVPAIALIAWGLMGVLMFVGDFKKVVRSAAIPLLLLGFTGCMRPFEPIKLEKISNTEEAFLIPLRGDKAKQDSTDREIDYKAMIISTKQVQIPQQWVQLGREWAGANGEWKDAAVLIRVDCSPVTREWTADPNSGTSNKNEAIWVQSADQIEWSTGWTCTARIATKEDAVKFLSNYPVGSLKDVLDQEVRSKIQAIFGLAVTDMPMETLRKNSTPVMQATIKEVQEFFKERGILITNLGITGGYIYKDQSIRDKMVEVYNAEQKKSINAAEFAAQEEKNKTIMLEATGKAKALLTEREAEAKGIKLVSDSLIAISKDNLPTYLAIKQLDIEREKLTRWNGVFPTTFFGSGGNGGGLNTLLNVPIPEVKK